MAAWRKKAYELFQFKPGSYSIARGKIDLFADLIALSRESILNGDEGQLCRIVEYVTWAAAQDSDNLASAVDLAFFLPILRDPVLRSQFEIRIPVALFSEKKTLLMPDGD